MEMIRNLKIAHIVKDDKSFCSARVITATLVDENGKEYFVDWVTGLAVEKNDGEVEYLETAEFVEAWEKAEIGKNVNLCYADGTNRKMFLIA